MIDAVRFGTYVDDPGRVAGRLQGATVSVKLDSIPTIYGYVGSLRAWIRADRLWVRGSLPTFLGKMAPLSRPLVSVAQERMEDTLGVDLGAAHVWGLELTADLRLSRPVGGYFPLLLRCPRLQRVEYGGESVAFAARVRRLTFYDKAVECRKRKKPVPSGNVLRLELQFRKRVALQLGADGPFTFADLHDRDWWPHLVVLCFTYLSPVRMTVAAVRCESLPVATVGIHDVDLLVRASIAT